MVLKNKYFNPNEYYYKVIMLCCLMGLDILLNSFTQFIDFGSTNIMNLYSFLNYDKDPGDSAYILIS